MKKCRKISVIVILSFILLSSEVFSLTEIFTQGEDFITDGKWVAEDEGKTINTDVLESSSSEIFNIFLGIGTIVAIIVGAVLGIQFMTAGIDRKVEVKQALFPYLISCLVMFSAFGIWKLVITIIDEIV